MSLQKVTIKDVESVIAANYELSKKNKRKRLEREAKSMSEGLAHQSPMSS